MDAERTEIARRFAACSKWVWLPGMLAASRHEEEQDFHPHRVVNVRIGGAFAQAAAGFRETYDIGLRECIPDLDDELTRIGCLAVVRRARSEPNGSLMPVIMQNGVVESWAYYSMVEGVRPMYAASETMALLAALEAAP